MYLQCLDHCIFESAHIFTAGIFNRSAFDEIVNKNLNDSSTIYWQELFRVSFDYCATEALLQEPALRRVTNLPPFDLDKTDCSLVPSFVIKCMMVYMTKV